jgi:riboflavin kinase / FMN adenylyltransferase
MVIHYGYGNLNLNKPVVTLGIFDGVHTGHRTLIDRLVTVAKDLKGESVVITFSPHPRIILQKDHLNLSFLNTMKEKQALLNAAGVDHLIILEFTEEFSKIEACEFVKKILAEKIGTSHLILGHNHHFGWKGEGNFSTILKCSELHNFKVEQVEGFTSSQGPVSSSVIRESLLNGRIEEANAILGYNYEITGEVVPGKKLGRKLGFPTANIKPDDPYKLIPGNGVYIAKVRFNESEYTGMLSIGSNPTVNDDVRKKSIEVHILDFEGDIYGAMISVVLMKRLRDERKFDNITQLTEQMMLDKENTVRFAGK